MSSPTKPRTSKGGARYDRGQELRNVEELSTGGIKVPAYITRTGVFTYLNEDGTKRREYRPAEEVFHADSLASLRAATITVAHPAGMVHTKTWKTDAVGHLGEDVKAEGRFVRADLYVQAEDAVKRVRSKDLTEVSAGYDCDLEWTAGVSPEGEAYDCIQRNIRYNHVALGGKNWGRAGSDVRIRADHNGYPRPQEHPMDEEDLELLNAKLNAKTLEHGIEKSRADSLTAERDALLAQVKTLTSERDTAAGERDAALKTAEKARTDSTDAVVEKKAAERVTLIDNAKRLCPTLKTEGQSARAIMVQAIKHSDSKFDDKDLSDDYVRGLFSGSLGKVGTKARADAATAIGGALEGDETEDGDAGDFVAAEDSFRQRSLNAWRGHTDSQGNFVMPKDDPADKPARAAR